MTAFPPVTNPIFTSPVVPLDMTYRTFYNTNLYNGTDTITIDESVRRVICVEAINNFLWAEKIEIQEHKRLIQMIQSPDYDNLTMVEVIIQELYKK